MQGHPALLSGDISQNNILHAQFRDFNRDSPLWKLRQFERAPSLLELPINLRASILQPAPPAPPRGLVVAPDSYMDAITIRSHSRQITLAV